MTKIEVLMMVGIIAVAGSVMVANRQPKEVAKAPEVVATNNNIEANAYSVGFIDGAYCGAYTFAKYVEMGNTTVDLDQLMAGAGQVRQNILAQQQITGVKSKFPPITLVTQTTNESNDKVSSKSKKK